jgi:hypothetical protein
VIGDRGIGSLDIFFLKKAFFDENFARGTVHALDMVSSGGHNKY